MEFGDNDVMDGDVLLHRVGKEALDIAVKKGYLKVVADDDGTLMGAKKYALTEKGKE